MEVENYHNANGKDIIRDEISKINNRDAREDAYDKLESLEENDYCDLEYKEWKGKIKEIYFHRGRYRMFFYIIDNCVYILHVCKKEKNKTEKKDSDIVLKRYKELEVNRNAIQKS